jgi:hypothetical protein
LRERKYEKKISLIIGAVVVISVVSFAGDKTLMVQIVKNL